MGYNWFKFYGQDYVLDTKMMDLNLAQKHCWIILLCLASNEGKDGFVSNINSEKLATIAGLKYDKIAKYDERESAGDVLKIFTDLGLIESGDGGVYIKNFSKRQDSQLTDAERAAKYRAKKTLRDERHAASRDERHDRIDKNRIDKNINISNVSRWITSRIDNKKPLPLKDLIEKQYG